MTRFSVIVPSIGRVSEVERLLESLVRQTCRDFEVILVDQNPDDRLQPLGNRYSSQFKLNHIRIESLGAARARNAGIAQAAGELLLWPDDDSWLPQDYLERASAEFSNHIGLVGLLGILVNEAGRSHDRWAPRKPRTVTLMDAFTLAAEPVLIFRREVVIAMCGFDNRLGTGAQTPWGAGEGTDLCVRALQANHRLVIDPQLTVHHARIQVQPGDEQQLEKARSYARGMGAVIRKNRLPLLFTVAYLSTYVRALLWNGLRGRWANVRYHWERIAGIFENWNLI